MSVIEPVLVHLLIRNAQQIIQSRTLVPRVRDMQFARRFAETSQRQNGRHNSPWNTFMISGDGSFQQLVELQSAPER